MKMSDKEKTLNFPEFIIWVLKHVTLGLIYFGFKKFIGSHAGSIEFAIDIGFVAGVTISWLSDIMTKVSLDEATNK